MKAAILHGRGDVRIEEVSPEPLKRGEVRMHIEAALTCGTDVKVFERGYHAKMISTPSRFGHEMAGVICALGEGASEAGWKIGDRVVAANSAPCGKCFFCVHHQENLCDDLQFLNGAYAETITVPERLAQKNLLRLKPQTDFRDAALTEPLACVVQGIEDSALCAGQNVLIIGAGPVGLMFTALANRIRCHVTVAGRHATRLQSARKLGAAHVVDVGDGKNLAQKIQAQAPAHAPARREPGPSRYDSGHGPVPVHHDFPGFDTVIEAVGRAETWEAAVALVRKGGTVNFFGGCPAGTMVALDTQRIHYSNLKLIASFHHTPRSVRRALEFIESGAVRAADFVSGECALSQLPAWFNSAAVANNSIKTLINVRQ
ncbi:MAG: alcohol dehydrogenase catalytic domain-containing protein [Verrucomicrobiota bacterium]|nr:alcohol dehydrogenase catalytic domain-containing protein [Verrucomicrobiota bacterium]